MPTQSRAHRQKIANLRSILIDMQEELVEDFLDGEYLCDRIGDALSALDTVDRDAGSIPSTAESLVQRIEDASDELLRREAEAKLHELARRIDSVQAIPGTFPYPCDVLTFSDSSQCYIPDRDKFAELAAVSLAEKYQLGTTQFLFGADLPRVLDPDGVLTEEEAVEKLELEAYAYAEKTKENYGAQFRNWVRFAEPRGVRIMPAHPNQVAAWMTYRADDLNHRAGTIRFGIEVLRTAHKEFGQPDPCDSTEVRRAMSSIRRRYGGYQEQVSGLTNSDIEAIEFVAHIPRRGRGGKIETAEYARARGDAIVAAVRLLHDGLLRPSEAISLVWDDYTRNAGGSGLIRIARSKTDQVGEGSLQLISADTARALERIRGDAGQNDKIFDFCARTLSRRIKAACAAAGLKGRYAGHSGRVGMAMDLVSGGATELEVMDAGRWRTRRMVRRYAQRQLAARSSVKRFLGAQD